MDCRFSNNIFSFCNFLSEIKLCTFWVFMLPSNFFLGKLLLVGSNFKELPIKILCRGCQCFFRGTTFYCLIATSMASLKQNQLTREIKVKLSDFQHKLVCVGSSNHNLLGTSISSIIG